MEKEYKDFNKTQKRGFNMFGKMASEQMHKAIKEYRKIKKPTWNMKTDFYTWVAINQIKETKDLSHFDLRGMPQNWVNAIKRVYESYPKKCMPYGICDMAYIINIITHELGIGDGKGNIKKFKVLKEKEATLEQENLKK